MSPSQRRAIVEFMEAIARLRDEDIVRSHRYLGDLGEFLCADAFGIDLASNLRQVGHDGQREDLRAQIKYHGGKTTTVNLGDPDRYDEVFVVLGPDSVLRPEGHSEEFLVYLLTAAEVRAFESENGNYFCTERRLPRRPTRCIGLSGIGA